MRAINNLSDVQLVLKQHDNWINSFSSKDSDRHGLRLTNNGAAKDPADYVILSQLPTPTVTATNDPNQHYTIVWDQAGVINVGDVIPAFIAGYERTGTPISVKILCRGAPSGGTCDVNIYAGADLTSGQNILKTDLSFPANGTAVVSSSAFIDKLPYIGEDFVVYPVINASNGANCVTIEVLLKRSKNSGS